MLVDDDGCVQTVNFFFVAKIQLIHLIFFSIDIMDNQTKSKAPKVLINLTHSHAYKWLLAIIIVIIDNNLIQM